MESFDFIYAILGSIDFLIDFASGSARESLSKLRCTSKLINGTGDGLTHLELP